jgi:hypothetical protein
MKAPLAGALLGLGLGAGLLLPAALSGGLPARGDLPDFFWPMKAYTAARWAGGETPLWNPLSGCGEPWMAQLQTGVFYPPDLVFLLPGAAGPFASIALHLAIAAAGMAAWLAGLGRSRLASLAGAAIWAGGGAFVSLIPVLNNFATAAFLPWIFLGAQRAVRGEGIATLGAASALAILGGEPALAVSGTFAATAVAWTSRREEPGFGGVLPGLAVRRLSAGLLLAAGLAAIGALPFAELLLESGRLTNVVREEALARSVGFSDLADVAWPPPSAITGGETSGRGGYLATLALGPVGLLFAAGGAAGLDGRRRTVRGLLAVAALGLVLSLGEKAGLSALLWESGAFRGLRFPARWFVFPHLVLALFAGAGVDGWRRESPDRGERLFGAGALGLGALLLVLALLDPARRTGDGPARAAVALAVAAGAAVLLTLRRRPGPELPWSGGLLLALLAVPLPWFSAAAVAAVPASEVLTPARIAAGPAAGDNGRLLVAVHDAHLLSRFATSGPTRSLGEMVRRAHVALAGYGNLRARVATAGTASPIENPRRARLLGAALGGGDAATLLSLADVRGLITPYPTTIPGAVLLRRADGVLRYALPAGAGRILFVRDVRVAGDDEVWRNLRTPGFEPEVTGFVATSPGPLPPARVRTSFSVARVVRDEPELLEIATSTSDPGLMVVTRSWDPGWKASLDGRDVPLLRADLAFQGVIVPAGEHVTRLAYSPASYRAGALVSGLSLLVLLGLALSGSPPLEARR